MRIYINKGYENDAQEWIKENKLDAQLRRETLSGDSYIDTYRNAFDATFDMIFLPPDFVNRYTEHEGICNSSFRRKDGIYKLGGAELSSKVDEQSRESTFTLTDGAKMNSGTRTFVKVTAPTLSELQAIYFAYRNGQLLPTEDWEAPQATAKIEEPSA